MKDQLYNQVKQLLEQAIQLPDTGRDEDNQLLAMLNLVTQLCYHRDNSTTQDPAAAQMSQVMQQEPTAAPQPAPQGIPQGQPQQAPMPQQQSQFRMPQMGGAQ